jgi:hypothetical protein
MNAPQGDEGVPMTRDLWTPARVAENLSAWEEYLETAENRIQQRGSAPRPPPLPPAQRALQWQEYEGLASEPLPPAPGEGVSNRSRARPGPREVGPGEPSET